LKEAKRCGWFENPRLWEELPFHSSDEYGDDPTVRNFLATIGIPSARQSYGLDFPDNVRKAILEESPWGAEKLAFDAVDHIRENGVKPIHLYPLFVLAISKHSPRSLDGLLKAFLFILQRDLLDLLVVMVNTLADPNMRNALSRVLGDHFGPHLRSFAHHLRHFELYQCEWAEIPSEHREQMKRAKEDQMETEKLRTQRQGQ